MEQKMSASFTGCKTEGEAIMNQAYFDAVIRRYQKMEELDPGWNRNSLKHLNWVLRLYGGNADFKVQAGCLYRRDWKSLSNYYYQCTRYNLFPTLMHFDYTVVQFWDALTAIALGDHDSFEHIFPKDEPLEKLIKDSKGAHPLVREGRILLVGLWYQNKQILEYTIPKAQMYLARKYPKPDLALVAYMLALHEHDVARAGECLETACQITRSAEWEPEEKKPWIYGHGLYRLAARVLPEDEFNRLPMPNYKTFCKEYAQWCNSHHEPLQFYAPFPEPVAFLNDMFTANYRSYPWIGLDEVPCHLIPPEWGELLYL